MRSEIRTTPVEGVHEPQRCAWLVTQRISVGTGRS